MRGIRRILLALLVVVVVAGAAFWYFVLRDTSSKKLTLKSDAPSATSAAKAPTSLAGTWKVVAGSGDQATVAGYRVLEKFAAGVAQVTATGRTPGVTGTVTVVGKNVTAATFNVDMTKLSSDKVQRDNQIRNRGVETNKFPKATFSLTAPVALPSITEGKVFKLTVPGNLTLHGVTKKVSLPLNAKESGSTFVIQGSLPIVMKDYAIDPPSIGGFVTVDDNGSLEFLANLAKG
jgi:polyisoprenoid-binding protein YceI